jgi:prolyl-tRNA synthetase
MMRDGKALQLATSHELGQNFARAFDITYTDEHGGAQHCWTTSWGSSTRLIGGLIMAHGDDAGLRLPPRVAPVQVVVVAVKDKAEVSAAVAPLERELSALGIRVRVDQRTDIGLGRRLTDWELKGVPVRIEVGPRDLADGQVSVVRRDDPRRDLVPVPAAAAAAVAAVEAVQGALLDQATALRARRTADVPDVASAIAAAHDGFVRLPWSECTDEAERALNAAGISIRCVTTPDGEVPASLDADGLRAQRADRGARRRVRFGQDDDRQGDRAARAGGGRRDRARRTRSRGASWPGPALRSCRYRLRLPESE